MFCSVPEKKCFHVPKTHCENVPVKAPVSVPLEKCWEVPRKHCQSIPVKKPRIVVKKVPVKHCEYKGHHDDHHGGGYGHDDHHGGGYGHDDHHGAGHPSGGYGHHRRIDDPTKESYSSTLAKLMKSIPSYHSSPPHFPSSPSSGHPPASPTSSHVPTYPGGGSESPPSYLGLNTRPEPASSVLHMEAAYVSDGSLPGFAEGPQEFGYS